MFAAEAFFVSTSMTAMQASPKGPANGATNEDLGTAGEASVRAELPDRFRLVLSAHEVQAQLRSKQQAGPVLAWVCFCWYMECGTKLASSDPSLDIRALARERRILRRRCQTTCCHLSVLGQRTDRYHCKQAASDLWFGLCMPFCALAKHDPCGVLRQNPSGTPSVELMQAGTHAAQGRSAGACVCSFSLSLRLR